LRPRATVVDDEHKMHRAILIAVRGKLANLLSKHIDLAGKSLGRKY
jgi:hypothetical protein